MKTEQIILQLQAKLPTLSPYFGTRLTIDSITKAGLVATVTTDDPHNLNAGDIVTISGVVTPTVIDTFTETAAEVVFETLTDHDYTKNENAPLDRNQIVFITSDNVEFFQYRLKSVPNRRKLVCFRDTAPALPTGTELAVQENALRGYNGIKQIDDVPTTTSFTYTLNFDLPEPSYLVDAFVATGNRISGAVDIDTVVDSYTKQPLDALWLFVVLGDYSANKDRRNTTDAFTTQGRQMDFRQKIIQSFACYIFVPNKGDILTKTNGRAGRDIVEDIRQPLFQSILGIDFDAELAASGQEVVTYAGDGLFSYNGAVYVHEFRFEQVIEITSGDTAIESFDRAFRDIDVIHRNQFSEITTYLSEIDLDDEPINS